MPSREEQFDQWYEGASGNDLYKALTEEAKSNLEDSFLDSRNYQDARDEFVLSELETGGVTPECFVESAWYDPSKDGDTIDEEESSNDLGEGD